MCKKQTSVSPSSTEAEIISLDAGLTHGWDFSSRSLGFGYWSVPFSHNPFKKPKGRVQGNLSRYTPSNKHTHYHTMTPIQHDNLELSNVDYVPSNAKFSLIGAMLCFFEDNETVIKMIIKGISPTVRLVSRTHRVALDWLFDRFNLDPKIQIKYVDTKHQLADILTKGNFTRDEWNNLLHLCNISHFSLLCCSQNFSLTSCTKTMAKRMREQEGDNRIVAKSKPVAMNLAVTVLRSSSSVNSPIASKSPGIPKASSRQIWMFRETWRKKKNKCQSRRSVEFSRMAKRMLYWMDVQGNLSHQGTKDIQETQELQEIQKTRKPKTKIGHIFTMYHQTVYLTWTKSSRS